MDSNVSHWLKAIIVYFKSLRLKALKYPLQWLYTVLPPQCSCSIAAHVSVGGTAEYSTYDGCEELGSGAACGHEGRTCHIFTEVETLEENRRYMLLFF